jgi:hypothetical protein
MRREDVRGSRRKMRGIKKRPGGLIPPGLFGIERTKRVTTLSSPPPSQWLVSIARNGDIHLTDLRRLGDPGVVGLGIL